MLFDDVSYGNSGRSLMREIELNAGNHYDIGTPFHISSFAPRVEVITKIIVDRNEMLIDANREDSSVLEKLNYSDDAKHIEDAFIKNYTILTSRRMFRRIHHGIKILVYGVGWFFGFSQAVTIQPYLDRYANSIMVDIVNLIVEYHLPKDAVFNCSRIVTAKPDLIMTAVKSAINNALMLAMESFSGIIGFVIDAVGKVFMNIFDTNPAAMSEDGFMTVDYMLEGDVPKSTDPNVEGCVSIVKSCCEKSVAAAKKKAESANSTRRPRAQRQQTATPSDNPSFGDDTPTFEETSTPVNNKTGKSESPIIEDFPSFD